MPVLRFGDRSWSSKKPRSLQISHAKYQLNNSKAPEKGFGGRSGGHLPSRPTRCPKPRQDFLRVGGALRKMLRPSPSEDDIDMHCGSPLVLHAPSRAYSLTTGDVPASMCHAPLRPDRCTFMPIDRDYPGPQEDIVMHMPPAQQPSLQRPRSVRAAFTPASAPQNVRPCLDTPARLRTNSPLCFSPPSTSYSIMGNHYYTGDDEQVPAGKHRRARATLRSPFSSTSPTTMLPFRTRRTPSSSVSPSTATSGEQYMVRMSPTPATAVALGLARERSPMTLPMGNTLAAWSDAARADVSEPVAIRPLKRRRSHH